MRQREVRVVELEELRVQVDRLQEEAERARRALYRAEEQLRLAEARHLLGMFRRLLAQEVQTPVLTQDWTHGFTDDHKGFAQNKGWKNPTDVVNSYQNLEKMLGAPRDQIIQLPREDDAGAWESVHTRLGRPATPDGYKLTSPEGGDPDFVKGIAAEFHKAGLNEKQAQGLVQWWNSRNEAQTAAQKTEFLGKLEADKTSLKKEWGAAHDQNTAIAARAVREFGVDTKIIDAMEKSVGFAATMKFFQSIGSKLGEGSFVTGRPAGGALTPEAAKSQIAALKQDHEFVKKYIAGDHKSRERMEVLHRYAFPEG